LALEDVKEFVILSKAKDLLFVSTIGKVNGPPFHSPRDKTASNSFSRRLGGETVSMPLLPLRL
jgi:hypothetical protein